MRSYSIAGRAIGLGHPCFIIAEAGVNHNGDPALALKLVDVAADMGADAVKFQTFSAEKLASQSAQMADYQKRNTEAEESQFAMLKKLELSRDAYPALLQRCRERGIVFLSSPFEEESADFLETCDVAAFKIPSGEITNIPYLRHIAAKNRPMIVSTGMATMAEIAAALDEIRASGNSPISLLQCYSARSIRICAL
jgi:N,N'-diacetyllegionaminate synthase